MIVCSRVDFDHFVLGVCPLQSVLVVINHNCGHVNSKDTTQKLGAQSVGISI